MRHFTTKSVLAACLLCLATTLSFAQPSNLAPNVSGGITTGDFGPQVVVGFWGYDDTNLLFVNGFDNQVGFAEYVFTGTNADVPIGATITAATISYTTSALFAGDHNFSYYTSTADGMLTLGDYSASTTNLLSGVSGSQGPVNIMSVIESILGAPGTGMPTTTGGAIGFRWDADFAAENITSATLFVDFTVPNNPPTADPGGPAYNFGAGLLTQTLDGSGSSDPDPGDSVDTWHWSVAGGANISTNDPTTPLHITQTGLATTLSSTSVSLVVEDSFGEPSTNPNSVPISYDNTGPTADAGSNLTFNALMGAQTADGSASTDPDLAVNGLTGPGGTMPNDFEVLTYTWRRDSDNAIVASGETPSISFAAAVAAGMTSTTATADLTLTVTDLASATSTDSLTLEYDNAAPTALSAVAVDVDGGQEFSGTFSDPDLGVNGVEISPGVFAPSDFEIVAWEFSLSNIFGSGFLTGDTTGLPPTDVFVDDAILDGLFPGPGTHDVFFNVQDRADATDSFAFQITIAGIPEPAAIVIWSILGAGALGWFVTRRRRAA